MHLDILVKGPGHKQAGVNGVPGRACYAVLVRARGVSVQLESSLMFAGTKSGDCARRPQSLCLGASGLRQMGSRSMPYPFIALLEVSPDFDETCLDIIGRNRSVCSAS